MVMILLVALLQTEPPADPARARQLYDEGLAHYNVAEYDQAIESFKAAYLISKAPGLLFNIALSYRLKGDCEQAVHFYKNYLHAQPRATQRKKIVARIEEMEKCAREKTAAAAQPPPPPQPPEKPAASASAAPPPPPAASVEKTALPPTGGAAAVPPVVSNPP